MILYDYFRSSSAYRVRIALNLKQLDYELHSINLLNSEQRSDAYLQKNPFGKVPLLVDGNKQVNQSLAILRYLDEHYPQPITLLPSNHPLLDEIYAFALSISCDIQPLNNLSVLQYLQNNLSVDDPKKMEWYHHWIALNFEPLERILSKHSGIFCFGDSVTLADICLIPQVYNALRFNHDLSPYPNILRIYHHCISLPAFSKAAPHI